MNKCDGGYVAVRIQCLPQVVQIDRSAPIIFDRDHLCPNPLGNPDPIFAKIGLHQGRLHINLFSLHVDRSGKLLKAIRDYLKHKK